MSSRIGYIRGPLWIENVFDIAGGAKDAVIPHPGDAEREQLDMLCGHDGVPIQLPGFPRTTAPTPLEEQGPMSATDRNVAIASDHAGFAMKRDLVGQLARLGWDPLDLGPFDEARVDYPDFAAKLAAEIRFGRAARGVLLCGSGIGISIAANRHRGIRAALVHDATTARLAREHNDANVLVLGARVLGPEVAAECLAVFLSTDYQGGRHAERLAKIDPPA